MRSRQYTDDILAPPSRKPVPPPLVAAENGLVVEDSAGDFCGAVVGCEKDAVTLEDRQGNAGCSRCPALSCSRASG